MTLCNTEKSPWESQGERRFVSRAHRLSGAPALARERRRQAYTCSSDDRRSSALSRVRLYQLAPCVMAADSEVGQASAPYEAYEAFEKAVLDCR